jgi:putative oxidoreductase
MWAFLSRNQALGQLLLRVGLGGIIIYVYGWKKLAGGIGEWRELGGAMKAVGINFWLPFWGFMGTLAGTLGMVLFIIGFAFRPACLLITLTATVAAVVAYRSGGIDKAAHAIELGTVFLSMMIIGPGKYSVDKQ